MHDGSHQSLCAGASLHRDDVDTRYHHEAETGTATYTGSVTHQAGIVDVVADVNGYTEANFGTGSRPAGFDTDNDGIPDEWEEVNGLDPNNANDARLFTIDQEKGWYSNLEVYLNSLVEDIMKAGNADAENTVDEYYPAFKQPTGIAVVRDAGQTAVDYYNLQGMKLTSPASGMVIRVTTYPDGTKESRKVMID